MLLICLRLRVRVRQKCPDPKNQCYGFIFQGVSSYQHKWRFCFQNVIWLEKLSMWSINDKKMDENSSPLIWLPVDHLNGDWLQDHHWWQNESKWYNVGAGLKLDQHFQFWVDKTLLTCFFAMCALCNCIMQFEACAICNTCHLQHMQFVAHAICNTYNLHHVQFATYASCN